VTEPRKHGRYCFCTDCCESREEVPEDFPDYDEWRKAFPELPWDENPCPMADAARSR